MKPSTHKIVGEPEGGGRQQAGADYSRVVFPTAAVEQSTTPATAPRVWVEAAKDFERGTRTAVETISLMIRSDRTEFEARAENPKDPCNLLNMFFYELSSDQWAGKVPVESDYIAQIEPNLTKALLAIAALTPD